LRKSLFKENHLTIATTKGAKGYDAYFVFLAGCDVFSADSAGRASFYVGATRSKLCLSVTGIEKTDTLMMENIKLANMLCFVK
jgi:superfamily I DNA and RNA helicase